MSAVVVSVHRSLLAVIVIGLGLSGCAPPCRTTCSKTLRCGIDSERIAQEECELSCNRELSLYQSWEDQTKLIAFRKHRRCIFNSSCEEIAAGECYDEELFEFDEPGTSQQ